MYDKIEASRCEHTSPEHPKRVEKLGKTKETVSQRKEEVKNKVKSFLERKMTDPEVQKKVLIAGAVSDILSGVNSAREIQRRKHEVLPSDISIVSQETGEQRSKNGLEEFLVTSGYAIHEIGSDEGVQLGYVEDHNEVEAKESEKNTKSAFLGESSPSSYDERIRHTPSLESNRWTDKRGDSICLPRSEAARQIMEERGIYGVQYHNGIPDFSPFSEATVRIGHMTSARHSEGLTAGRDSKSVVYAHFDNGEIVSKSHHADKSSMAQLYMKYYEAGNFEQADILTAEQWTIDGREGKEWSAEDVALYRKEHGLTWHECNDMETMQMIPEAINADFGHLGGVGEVKETQGIIGEILHDYDEGRIVEAEDYDRLSPDELSVATREHGHYTDDGFWIPDDKQI